MQSSLLQFNDNLQNTKTEKKKKKKKKKEKCRKRAQDPILRQTTQNVK